MKFLTASMRVSTVAAIRLAAILLLILLAPCPCLADEAPTGSGKLAVAESRLAEIKSTTGHGPSVDQFATIAGEEKLEPADVRDLWRKFASLHESKISKAQILRAVQASRARLRSLDVTLEYESVSTRTAPPTELVQQARFVMSDGCLYLSTETKKSSQDEERKGSNVLYVRDLTIGYDREVVRTLSRYSQGYTNGAVDFYRGSSQLAESDLNPLAKVMLWESGSTNESSALARDLTALVGNASTVVLEEPQTVAGRSAVVVTDGNLEAYLDVERGFALLQLIECVTSESGPRRMKFNRQLSDFINRGDDMWLPDSIVETSYDIKTGAPWQRKTLAIEKLSLQEAPEDKLFRDVFPVGTYVNDATRGGQGYQAESPPQDSPTIEKLRPTVMASLREQHGCDANASGWTLRAVSSMDGEYIYAWHEKHVDGRRPGVPSEEVVLFDGEGKPLASFGGRLNSAGTQGQTVKVTNLGAAGVHFVWVTSPREQEGFKSCSEFFVIKRGLPLAMCVLHHVRDTMASNNYSQGEVYLMFRGQAENWQGDALGTAADGQEYSPRITWDSSANKFQGPSNLTLGGQKAFEVDTTNSTAFIPVDKP